MAKVSKKVSAKKEPRSDEPREVAPVYFLSLEVENVLCFKDRQVLDLTDKNGNPAQWTVILGDNGVGKTTLLRFLASMECRQEYSFDEKPSLYWPLFISSPSFMKTWIDMVTLHMRKRSDEAPNSNCLLIARIASLVSLAGLKQKPGLNYRKGEIDTFRSGGLKSEMAGELICYGYGAIRNLGSGALSENSWKDNSLSLFSEGAPLINAEEWMLQTDYAYQTAKDELKSRLEKQLEQIFDVLKQILPDVDDIHIAPATEENPHPRAEFLTPYGWVHINSLGLGYRTAIAWMVDLAVRLFRRYPNSPDPLAEPAIVLVDEIDLHLHPRWQRTIMDFLTDRFPNTQFIVTAHSPLVVQAAQNANIVLLRREGDRVVIDNDPEIIENWRVDQVLTSLFELPTARSVELEPLLLRREALLDKAHLSKEDKAELATLSDQIGSLPTAESPQEIKAMNIIRRAAKYLENQA
jgi:predicted ATP-binding protein involved in virulence